MKFKSERSGIRSKKNNIEIFNRYEDFGCGIKRDQRKFDTRKSRRNVKSKLQQYLS